MIKHFLKILLISCLCIPVYSQTIATFDVTLTKPASDLSVPAKLNLDEFTFLGDSSLALFEITGNTKTPIPVQIRNGECRELYWLINEGGVQKHTYQLVQSAPKRSAAIVADNSEGSITFKANDKNLLRYQYATVYPPAGIDTNYKRSGFIHPVWTPHGQELTRIQAPDHYHHYGIWNPWTHVLFEKDTVDFWNLRDKKGTVRFANFTEITSGEVFSEFSALHQHVVFKKDGSEKIALNELQTVRLYNPQPNSNYYIADITAELNCATDSPVLILSYRYAGLGWRTTGYWNDENCEVLTSEGKTRDNTDGSKGRWAIVQGALPDNESGGIAFLSYPANFNHPEPMRIWVKGTNKRGDMFFNFAPTKDKDWLLEPGKTYVLKYRLVVFSGKLNAAGAESAWQYFAKPVMPEIRK